MARKPSRGGELSAGSFDRVGAPSTLPSRLRISRCFAGSPSLSAAMMARAVGTRWQWLSVVACRERRQVASSLLQLLWAAPYVSSSRP
eukprot:7724163-Alexandrium_andersonii.AAC.1